MERVERKARVGQTYRFIWVAPAPVEGTPVLRLFEPGSSTAHASSPQNLVELRTEVEVTAIDADLVRLTAPTITVAGSRGAAGKYGRAFFIAPGGGYFPVHVSIIADGEITLAEDLNRHLEGSTISGAKLRWATYTVELDAAITAAAARGWRWQVEFTAYTGDDIFASPAQSDSGLLHVVHNPFDTGLTSTQLMDWFPQAIPLRRAGAQDFSAAIELAEEMLIARIRAHVAKNDGTGNEDQLEGSDFRRIHALFACADLIEHDEPEQARTHRAKAFSLFDERMMNTSWYDEDNDGVVDDGETDRQPRRSVPAGWYATNSDREPQFGYRKFP